MRDRRLLIVRHAKYSTMLPLPADLSDKLFANIALHPAAAPLSPPLYSPICDRRRPPIRPTGPRAGEIQPGDCNARANHPL